MTEFCFDSKFEWVEDLLEFEDACVLNRFRGMLQWWHFLIAFAGEY